jgi:nucleotide-binding universal stress UspA family protein
MINMTTATPPAAFLHLVVGYDGSPPASRALDAAVSLLQGRTGRIEVVYVAHLSSLVSLSPGAIAAKELRASAAEQLGERVPVWEFQRRQGLIAEELIAAANEVHDADASKTVVIVVGSSSHAAHRMVGSAAVSLARHAPVPLIIVP